MDNCREGERIEMKSKCCNSDVFIKEKSGQKCVYCKSCGKFIKNANKDDLREIEANNSEVEPINSKYTIMIMELQNLINAINKTVNEEDNNFPKSDLDAIRKSSKVYELERVKWSLLNILDGRTYNDDGM